MRLFVVMIVLLATTISSSNCTFKKWKKFYSSFEPFFDYFKKKPRHHGKIAYHKEVIHHKQIPIIIPVGHLAPHFGYGGQHGHDYGHVGVGHGHEGHIIVVGQDHGGHTGGFEGHDKGFGGHHDFGEQGGLGHEINHNEYGLGGQGLFYGSQRFDHHDEYDDYK